MSFSGMSIPKELFNSIKEILPEGETILELGSGGGTDELLKLWNVISIEDNTNWLIDHKGKYPHIFINAPIKRIKTSKSFSITWYDSKVVEKGLEQLKYDLILVDGPNGKYGRKGFQYFYDKIFNINVPIVIDDLQARKYLFMAQQMCSKYNKELKFVNAPSRKTSYGILINKGK